MVDCCWAETNAIRISKLASVVVPVPCITGNDSQHNEQVGREARSKVSIAISQKERGQIKKMLWRLVKETFEDDDGWDKADKDVLKFCDHKQKEIDEKFGDASWATWQSFRNYLQTQWGTHRKLWADILELV